MPSLYDGSLFSIPTWQLVLFVIWVLLFIITMRFNNKLIFLYIGLTPMAAYELIMLLPDTWEVKWLVFLTLAMFVFTAFLLHKRWIYVFLAVTVVPILVDVSTGISNTPAMLLLILLAVFIFIEYLVLESL